MPVDDEEPDELLEPGHRLLGVPDQAEVQPEALVVLGLRRVGGVQVVDQDDRVVADLVGGVLEDLDRLLGGRG